jgi:hypothetical protein
MAQEAAARPEPSPFYTKPTFAALSQAIDNAVQHPSDTGAWEHLKDQLFLSPRLTQWITIPGGVGSEFRIYSAVKTLGAGKTYISVYKDRVFLTKDVNKEYEIIGDPNLAETLWDSIQNAQAIIQPVEPKPFTETEQEEFFDTRGDADYQSGAELDAALEETHADPMIEEDAQLIEEVVADTEDPLGKIDRLIAADGASGQIAVDDEVPYAIQNQLHDAKIKNHVGKINKSAASEAEDIKEEYKDRAPQKSKASQEELAQSALIGRSALSRLKSLQGRVLNIVEASFSDKQQREAVKTLVNKEFRREMNKLNELRGVSESEE